jgi:exosortase/archaeosortase family protein
MTRDARWTYLRIGLMVFTVVVGFLLLQEPFRQAETELAAAILSLFAADHVEVVLKYSIQVFPADHDAFRAEITPSCSSLASLLVLACLGMLSPRLPGRHFAIAAALAAVAVANVIRVVASVGVGLLAGRSSLVLFHDWVGSAFTFLYIVGGYMLMVYLLLPRERTALRLPDARAS